MFTHPLTGNVKISRGLDRIAAVVRARAGQALSTTLKLQNAYP